MDLNQLTAGERLPDEFNVVIEIPAFSSPIKYEIDKKSGALFVDRFIGTGMSYPANYGFVPQTLSQDGDPVDVLVITPFSLAHQAVITCRALGVLKMEDESGIDAKIIALPTRKICQLYDKIDSMEQLPSLILEQIKHFFTHYKALEAGKWVKITGFGSSAEAHQEIVESIERYRTT